MLKTVLAGVGLTAIVLVAAVSISAGYYPDGGQPRSLAVNYAAFDLRTPQGVALLERRIDEAVARVCGGSSRWSDINEECARDAWAGARPQIARAVARARWHRHPSRWTPDAIDSRGPERFEAPPPREYAPSRYEPLPAEGGWGPPRPEPGAWTPPPPLHRGGVLGGPIDDRIGRAFQTGVNVPWRDNGWRGLVQVSVTRDVGRSICRTVTIVRSVDGAWQVLREGVVCLRPDGALHNEA